MTPQFNLTRSAEHDIDEILEYVLEPCSAEMADHVHRELLKGIHRIAERPRLLGHKRADLLDESLRVYVVFSCLIVYDPTNRPVQIIRAIHGARDLARTIEKGR